MKSSLGNMIFRLGENLSDTSTLEFFDDSCFMPSPWNEMIWSGEERAAPEEAERSGLKEHSGAQSPFLHHSSSSSPSSASSSSV